MPWVGRLADPEGAHARTAGLCCGEAIPSGGGLQPSPTGPLAVGGSAGHGPSARRIPAVREAWGAHPAEGLSLSSVTCSTDNETANAYRVSLATANPPPSYPHPAYLQRCNGQELPLMPIGPPPGDRRAVPSSPPVLALWRSGCSPPILPTSWHAVDLHVSDVGADRPPDVEEREGDVAGEMAGALGWQAAGATGSAAAQGAGTPDPVPMNIPIILYATVATVTVITHHVDLATAVIRPCADPAAHLVVCPRFIAPTVRSPRPPALGVSHPRRRRRLMKGLRHGAVVR